MLKRFLLFAGSNYYPAGGWQDFRGDFDTVEEAKDYLLYNPDTERNWWHVIDATTGAAVEKHPDYEW